MSLEAWGDEGNVGPEGYVTEELFEEERARWRSIGTAPKDDVPIITASNRGSTE